MVEKGRCSHDIDELIECIRKEAAVVSSRVEIGDCGFDVCLAGFGCELRCLDDILDEEADILINANMRHVAP